MMMNRAKFHAAIKETNPVPCDGCRYFEICRLNKLACTKFKSYVNEGSYMTSRRPSRKIYKEIFER